MYSLLLPLACIYDGVTSVRNFMYNHRILKTKSYDLPVICVGNLTVGGTGKTPHTEYLVRLLQREGYKVAVLSRGYKRKTRGYVLATTASTAADIGDEPYQMKIKFPSLTVAVDADRCEGVERLMKDETTRDVDVILLDDAFQHRRIQAGMNIVLVDSNRPIDKDYLLPAGRLRENISGLKRADIILVTKLKGELDEATAHQYKDRFRVGDSQQLYFTRFCYGDLYQDDEIIPLNQLNQYHVLMVTGIADATPMEQMLKEHTDVTTMRFGDHHAFTQQDYECIEKAYQQLPDVKPGIVVITEKDRARLDMSRLTIKKKVYTLPIEVEVLQQAETIFNQQILDYVRKNSRNSIVPQGTNDK